MVSVSALAMARRATLGQLAEEHELIGGVRTAGGDAAETGLQRLERGLGGGEPVLLRAEGLERHAAGRRSPS